jgi:hypothetical protein
VLKKIVEVGLGWAAKPLLGIVLKVSRRGGYILIEKLRDNPSSMWGDLTGIEAMINDNSEKFVKLQRLGISPVWLLPQTVLAILDFSVGVIKIGFNKISHTFHVMSNVLLVAINPNDSRLPYQLASLIENYRAASVTLDPDIVVRGWGLNAEIVFGFRRGDVINRCAHENFIPESERGFMSQKLFRDPEMFRVNYNENTNADGTKITVFWLNMPIYDQGRLISMQCYGVPVFSPVICKTIIFIWQSMVKFKRAIQS